MDQSNPQNQQPAGQVVDVSYDEQPGNMGNSQPPKKKHARKILLTFLGIILVSGVGFGSWLYATDTANKKSDQKIEDLERSIADLKKEVDKEDAKQADEEGKYLVITQWNVKLESTKSPMSYRIAKLDDGSEALYLKNQDTISLEDESQCPSDGNGLELAILSRSKDSISEDELRGVEIAAKFGGYTYYASGAQGTCTDNPKEVVARNELLEAAKSVRAN